ncbi:hypothetical protein [Polynucleobacter sp. JS-JIR-II-50]|uniref:hypothetical protein n=1 Tax=Polynucleobacter sp. JS-JIR-II-50 TaxID=2576919 RepID=UPI001BFDA345|nr:hypothetical protein [Polynucleobacter sp. JS-JIR-II-50]QWE05432.1 hypothetical protein FD963_05220 [Polynucleobacter sp. JS-JIR-II-50]
MTNSAKNSPNKPGLKLKLEDEMRKALALTLYFGIWFCAITFMATTALEERPIPLTLFGFALIKAGLSAKFMLIAQAAYPIKVDKEHGIVGPLFVESIVYIVVIIALNYIEAGVDGLIHGKEFITSMAAFGSGDPLRVLAMSIVYWLIVWPYLIFVGFNKVVGNTETLAVLFGSKK